MLDEDPAIAAQMHCDQHVGKMLMESAQLLSSAHHILRNVESSEINPYGLTKLTHKNHPCALWVRKSLHNYNWLFSLASNLSLEFKFRRSKLHASSLRLEALKLAPSSISDIGPTFPALAMPVQYHNKNPITSYRNYYKSKVFKNNKYPKWEWGRSKPDWYVL